MTSDNRARLRVAMLIFVMVNAVVFGVGLVIVLTMPALSQHAFLWIPIVVVSSFVVSAAAGMAHRPDDDAAVHSSAEYALTLCGRFWIFPGAN
jgi:hypothetical protein